MKNYYWDHGTGNVVSQVILTHPLETKPNYTEKLSITDLLGHLKFHVKKG